MTGVLPYGTRVTKSGSVESACKMASFDTYAIRFRATMLTNFSRQNARRGLR